MKLLYLGTQNPKYNPSSFEIEPTKVNFGVQAGSPPISPQLVKDGDHTNLVTNPQQDPLKPGRSKNNESANRNCPSILLGQITHIQVITGPNAG
jgi:hypothetical protein